MRLASTIIRTSAADDAPDLALEANGCAHLVGICGAGMKALAELLAAQGWRVTGSDLYAEPQAIARFARQGVHVQAGHTETSVPPAVDLLVYSAAIEAHNPERRAAARRRIPQLSYSQMLGKLMQGRPAVCIAGTHGKSTTTAMTGWILSRAGQARAVLVGAEVRELGASGWLGDGQNFVVESCEYERNFLYYSPQIAAILGVEADHFDCYENLDDVVAAFAAFARKVPRTGRLIVPYDCTAAQAACSGASAKLVTFGLSAGANWRAARVCATAEGVRFTALRNERPYAKLALRVPGEHNVLNALAAAAVAHEAGVGAEEVRASLAEFPGVKRRFEPVGRWNGAVVIDDYAHHPTAVRCTLKTARQRFPGRPLWCLFQPHQVSRTLALLNEFAAALVPADRVLVAPVYSAREPGGQADQAGRLLCDYINAQGGQARFMASLDRARATLDDELAPGDVLVTMGAGDINQVHHAFAGRA